MRIWIAIWDGNVPVLLVAYFAYNNCTCLPFHSFPLLTCLRLFEERSNHWRQVKSTFRTGNPLHQHCALKASTASVNMTRVAFLIQPRTFTNPKKGRIPSTVSCKQGNKFYNVSCKWRHQTYRGRILRSNVVPETGWSKAQSLKIPLWDRPRARSRNPKPEKPRPKPSITIARNAKIIKSSITVHATDPPYHHHHKKVPKNDLLSIGNDNSSVEKSKQPHHANPSLTNTDLRTSRSSRTIESPQYHSNRIRRRVTQNNYHAVLGPPTFPSLLYILLHHLHSFNDTIISPSKIKDHNLIRSRNRKPIDNGRTIRSWQGHAETLSYDLIQTSHPYNLMSRKYIRYPF